MSLLSEVVARAAVGDPWERAAAVTATDPAPITAAAAGFGAAAEHARTATAAAARADTTTAEHYLVDGTGVHDAATATRATRAALGDGGEHPELIARLLGQVAADLTTTQARVRGALTALEHELDTITAASAPLAGPDAAAAEQALLDRAVAAVRTHGTTINAELDAYDRVLAARTATLADLGYAPAPDPEPPDPGPDETDPSPAAAAADWLAGLGEAVRANPEAVIGLLTGAGLVTAGAGAVLAGGTATVGSGGALAAAGLPTAAAGVGLIGVGGAMLVASVDQLAAATVTAVAARRAKRGTTPSVNQAQKEVERGNAPPTVDRFDKGNPQLHEKPHVHLKDGNALNQDGTWKHGPGRELSTKEKEFLGKYGWKVPK